MSIIVPTSIILNQVSIIVKNQDRESCKSSPKRWSCTTPVGHRPTFPTRPSVTWSTFPWPRQRLEQTFPTRQPIRWGRCIRWSFLSRDGARWLSRSESCTWGMGRTCLELFWFTICFAYSNILLSHTLQTQKLIKYLKLFAGNNCKNFMCE